MHISTYIPVYKYIYLLKKLLCRSSCFFSLFTFVAKKVKQNNSVR